MADALRSGKPSSTAALVTLARALAHDGITRVSPFADPTADRLLPQPYSRMRSVVGALAHDHPVVARALWYASLGVNDVIAWRTAAIDEAVEAAAPIEQLVILGAGLDGRAFRLESLRDAVVFEVDHPSTQAFKRACAEQLRKAAREVRFVPVDFERDSLERSLAVAGHRRETRTFWICEGVFMYLHHDAIRETLRQVGEMSAAGSRFAATYLLPNRRLRSLSPFLRALGEPALGLAVPDFSAAGFRVLSDDDAASWARGRAVAPPVVRLIGGGERLVVAERDPLASRPSSS